MQCSTGRHKNMSPTFGQNLHALMIFKVNCAAVVLFSFYLSRRSVSQAGDVSFLPHALAHILLGSCFSRLAKRK